MVQLVIDDKRIKKIAEEVIEKLTTLESDDPRDINAFVFTVDYIADITLTTWEEWENELREDIKSIKDVLKISRESRKHGRKDEYWKIRELNYYQKQNKKLLDEIQTMKRRGGLGRMLHDAPPWEMDKYLTYSIRLIKDYLVDLSDDEIWLVIGHEIAHVYLDLIANHRYPIGYEIEDKAFCNFVAEHWMGIKSRAREE